MDFINRAAAIWSKTNTAFPFAFDPKAQKNIDRDALWAICDGTKRVTPLLDTYNRKTGVMSRYSLSMSHNIDPSSPSRVMR
jgi:hypothetical protein